MGFSVTPPNSIRSLIFKSYEAAKAAKPPYAPVGINVGDLGHECDRKLWYDFRRVSPPEKVDGRKESIFETGKYWEERLTEKLIEIGCYVSEEQESVKFVGGHVRGRIDGEVRGVPEAPKTVHIVEFKSSNDKGFKELLTKGLQKGKPLHYAQCQMYMHGRSLTRALYVCINKNDNDIFERRVEYDAAYCLKMLARAERIIKAEDPPSKCSENPRIPPCAWCRHKEVCHEGEWARRNCRTCLHATAITTSDNACWDCAKWNKPLTLDEQKVGCPSHRFIPALVPGEQTDVQGDDVVYKLKNGETWVNVDGT